MVISLRRSQRRTESSSAGTNALDHYVTTFPSPQSAVDIFANEWSSRFPAPFAHLEAGSAELFDDVRIRWMIEQLGGIADSRVLELGPLEGGHTYLLDRAGAAQVMAVESNTRAFLKCLVVKEIVGIPSAQFVCGDFVRYLERCEERFDLVVASGVLYHLIDPVAVIARCAEVTDRLFIWTHYYDDELLGARAETRGRLTEAVVSSSHGFEHRRFRQEYGSGIADRSFCGGSRPFANWLDREGLFGALDHVGFTSCDVAFEHVDHPQGPSLCILARR